VTGGYGDFGGGGMPQRIIVTRDLCRCCALPERGNRETRPALAREVAYIALDDEEQRRDGGLIGGDAVQVTHTLSGLTFLKVRQLSHVVALPLNSELNAFADTRYFFHLTPSA